MKRSVADDVQSLRWQRRGRWVSLSVTWHLSTRYSIRGKNLPFVTCPVIGGLGKASPAPGLYTLSLHTSLMRVKVECGPPLPAIKAWFAVPAVLTVHDLKESVCSGIPALHELGIAADNFTFVVDGFELLDTSAIDVVRDGDLIR